MFNSAEIKYVQIEKYLYALVIVARKLRPYFHAHAITVLTNQPLKHFLLKPDSSRRMIKWAIELSEFKIKFAPKTVIKGQAFADFIVESIGNGLIEAENRPSSSADTSQGLELYTDGPSSREGSGEGLILIPPEGEPLKYAITLTFKATNNEAEYEVLITGLRLAKGMGITSLKAKSDSELIFYQVNGTYEAKGEKMNKYLEIAKKRIAEIPTFAIESIPRQENQLAFRGTRIQDVQFIEQALYSVLDNREEFFNI